MSANADRKGDLTRVNLAFNYKPKCFISYSFEVDWLLIQPIVSLCCLNSLVRLLLFSIKLGSLNYHHKILLQILNKRFKDNLLLKFFSDLIDTYQVSNDRGIPIGNLLSQYFANMYLAVLDHEIKERIRVKGYLRYMDDFLCFSDDKYFLIQVQNRIENFVDNNLLLCLNKPQMNKCCYGIPFTSSRIKFESGERFLK